MKPSIYPSYYKEFSCIGRDCEDSCCDERWKIAIDQKTFYQYLGDPYLKNFVKKHESPTKANYGDLKRTSTGACALLTECGICSVHKDYGENYLSETCTVYPRIKNEVEGVVERSMSPSCPEVGRLLLFKEEGVVFEQVDALEEGWDHAVSKYEIPLLWPLRIGIIRLLQSRVASFGTRMTVVGLFLNKMQQYTSRQQEAMVEKVFQLYEMQLHRPEFVEKIESVARQDAIYLELGTFLISSRLKGGYSSPQYLNFIQCFSEGLQIDKEITDSEKVTYYRQMKERYYDPYMKEKEYVLENYFVNQVFKELVPFDEKTYMQSYLKLVTHVTLLKLHLVGNAAYHQGLTDELVVETTYLYGRQIEQNSPFLERTIQFLKDEGLYTMGHMTILLQS